MAESVAIVTGASQGIGGATAMRLARDFSALTLVARNRDHLEQTAEAVRAAGAVPQIGLFEMTDAQWMTGSTTSSGGL